MKISKTFWLFCLVTLICLTIYYSSPILELYNKFGVVNPIKIIEPPHYKPLNYSIVGVGESYTNPFYIDPLEPYVKLYNTNKSFRELNNDALAASNRLSNLSSVAMVIVILDIMFTYLYPLTFKEDD